MSIRVFTSVMLSPHSVYMNGGKGIRLLGATGRQIAGATNKVQQKGLIIIINAAVFFLETNVVGP